MAGSVIQATGTVEFEDGLRTGVLPGDCWCPWCGRTYPRINTKPRGGGWSWVGCGCHKDSILDLIPTSLVQRISGIKLQLLCADRIEPFNEAGMIVLFLGLT